MASVRLILIFSRLQHWFLYIISFFQKELPHINQTQKLRKTTLTLSDSISYQQTYSQQYKPVLKKAVFPGVYQDEKKNEGSVWGRKRKLGRRQLTFIFSHRTVLWVMVLLLCVPITPIPSHLTSGGVCGHPIN